MSEEQNTQGNNEAYAGLVERAVLDAIKAGKKDDPLIGMKMGADDIYVRFIDAFKDERGIHIETYLTAIAALAGFSCQMAVREGVMKDEGLGEEEAFSIVKTTDGARYFLGNSINMHLAESPLSLWNFVANGVHTAEGDVPDILDIYSHSADSLGREDFGKPRVPEAHAASTDTPQSFVENLWPGTQMLLEEFCDKPMEWPIVLGMSLQKTIVQAKTVIPPTFSGLLIMDVAVAMSKIDPKPLGII